MEDSPLSNSVAIVTGASRGIGRSIAESLAARGVSLMLVGRNAERLRELSHSLGSDSGSAHVATCATDLAGPSAPAQIVAAVTDEFGRLDLLINNAGVAEPASIEETELEQWDKHMAINARAPYLLSRHALPLLRASERARILNIGSVVSHKGYAKQGAYAASKHALYGLTKVLAKELQPDGIRVQFIAPGGVATDMISGIRPDIDPAQLIEPAEVARAACFLLEQGPSAATDELSLRRDGSEPWK